MREQALAQLTADLTAAFHDPSTRVSLEMWLQSNNGSIGVELYDSRGIRTGWWEGTLTPAEAEEIWHQASRAAGLS